MRRLPLHLELGIACTYFLMGVSCGPDDSLTTGTEARHGIGAVNELQDVEDYAPKPGHPFANVYVDYYHPAAGRPPGCSGTLISRDLLITNGHCISSATVGSNVQMNFQNSFGPGGSVIPPTADLFPITAVLECAWPANCAANLLPSGLVGVYDYAILRLGTNASGDLPGDKYGWRHFNSSPPGPMVAEARPVAVIGFPQGLPKRLDTGALINWDGFNLSHTADTLPGSSGSAVLDIDGKIVSLNASSAGVTSIGGYGPSAEDIVRVSSLLDYPIRGNRYQMRNGFAGCLDVPNFWQASSFLFANNCKTDGFESNQLFTFEPQGANYEIIVEHSKRCLELPTGGSGTEVNQEPCNGALAQQWSIQPHWFAGGFSVCSSQNPSTCLERSATTQRLVKGSLTPFPGNSAEVWFFDLVPQTHMIEGHTGLCLDIPGFSTADGITPNNAFPCAVPLGGIPFNQEWFFRIEVGGDFEIVNAFSKKCLGIDGTTTAQGQSIAQYECDGSTYQKWTHIAKPQQKIEFRNVGSGLCMDLFQNRLQTYFCGGFSEQIFDLRRGIN